MPPVALLDPALIDTSRVLVDQEGIRAKNPQRFEMEQLTAIVYLDGERHIIAGYKDIGTDEFWIRGHMPGFPLMPGVLLCEAAAQLASFYTHSQDLLPEGCFMGFAGMEEVRFRGQVKPGDRLVLVGQAVKLSRRQSIFETQGFVNGDMVFQARILGIAIHGQVNATPKTAASASAS
ncbi:Beta-hydroxyacyl-(acyl-carrier-protein) dehydratase FabA/FabZ [Isosphaera pallida ATCC 43644]|uniref:Beta-hydroxyacyl-(Acyl-carrier-protein) dehydratase FabA/FabZ n=1 Tax=Isosphaera pallida (strain ATCC 43644 / DSM 9630 / IS1B) TaxID=575540 RepID=E8R2G3_ISOPI|nr:3-hydroxyacyl-ACP dehydratase FabZ family protein [Isosphaera pallida]ADV61448.1 Beta-hydroxyacyl-(acyl-carrier-protein) dehydratase FabA/FabZ [Isosphaera pallida ATCC 43644]